MTLKTHLNLTARRPSKLPRLADTLTGQLLRLNHAAAEFKLELAPTLLIFGLPGLSAANWMIECAEADMRHVEAHLADWAQLGMDVSGVLPE